MALEPKLLDNPQDNFEELVNLSKRTASPFVVLGDYKNFVIKTKAYNILSVIILVVFISLMLLIGLLIKESSDPTLWFIELGFLTLGYAAFRFGGLTNTNDIEVDTLKKIITFKNNNLLGKYIIPTTMFEFNSFKEFTCVEIYTKGFYANRIYINFDRKKREIINLPNGPIGFINPKIFMASLTRLIKNGAEQSLPKSTEPYLGDLDKTDILFSLVQIPKAERDENWKQLFLENISEASFQCGDPEVKTGPDGFPYFQLFLPEPNKQFQCFVIDRMKDDFLLEAGYGVVINPAANSADWVLAYGDILNLHLNKTFYTTTKTAFSGRSNEINSENEKVLYSQPSETILPKQTRQLIATFLKNNGIKSPSVLLMTRSDGNVASQDLVFNFIPENFKDDNAYRRVMQTISWYLPRHYSFAGADERELGHRFMPL